MRCPACRAENAETICRRCKADLTLLFAIDEQRAFQLAVARDALFQGRHDAALSAIAAAENSRHGSDAVRLRSIACLLSGDYLAAWNAYCSMVNGNG